MLELSTALLGKFQDLIYGESYLRFSPSRLIILETGLRERTKALGISSYDEYYNTLARNSNEFDILIDRITTKETHFFRLKGQFDVMRDEILPGLEKRLLESKGSAGGNGGTNSNKVPLRIWSAGCATGEEPYSIAMTVMEGLKYQRSWDVEILATDISQNALTRAKAGVFNSEELLKRVPLNYREKYLISGPEGVRVSDEIINKIKFRVFNLQNLVMEKGGLCSLIKEDNAVETIDMCGRFDIIFCRNVMIYFDLAAQQRLVDSLFACLKPGGYLFTGDAELLHIYEHEFKSVESEGTVYYRTPEIARSRQDGAY